jgi:hypothetical protein
MPEAMSPAARDFITRALAKHSVDRPSVLQMLQHDWLKAYPARSSPAGLGSSQAMAQALGSSGQMMAHGHPHGHGPQWSQAVERLWQGFAVLSSMWSWMDADNCGLLQPQPQPAAQLQVQPTTMQ